MLHKNSDEEWIGDSVYSPNSFVDLSMLILLDEAEKRKALANRGFLVVNCLKELERTIKNT